YLSFIENGRANPTLDMMVKLSEAVDTNLCKMLCEGD
ncbi:helix-turn-helix transcriptional regulator, partial [Listeria monocytogenes]|nr:helix-turn-helix transcriptional regulator [Listeria monocytogenes]